MSIYTYKINKNLCEIFNTEYFEHPDVSDQELDRIPENSNNKISGGISPTSWKKGNIPWNKGRVVSEEERQRLKKMCENRIPWNKGKIGVQKHSEEWKLNHSKQLKGRSLSDEHKLKLSLSQKGKPRPYIQRNNDGKFVKKVSM